MDKARILADSNNKQSKPCQTTNCTAVGEYGIRPKCANYVMAAGCYMVRAVAYRAYAIRPYK